MNNFFALISVCLLGVAVCKPNIEKKSGDDLVTVISGRAVTQNLTVNNPFNPEIGVWGEIEMCVAGSYAHAFELRYNPPGNFDETAVTEVKLYCTTPAPENQDTGYIHSIYGDHGTYYGMNVCTGSLMTGFRTNTQEDQGLFTDDVAVVDVEVDCNNGREIISSGIPAISRFNNQARDFALGDWSVYATCMEGSAVCGLQTRYENAALSDEAAICEVRMFCCGV